MKTIVTVLTCLTLLLSMPSPAPAQSGLRILEIKVVDAKSKEPIAGVAIKLTGSMGNKALRDAKDTDAGGMVSLILAGSGPAEYVYVTARKTGYVPKRLSWRKSADAKDAVPASYTLTMETGTKISGQVVDDSDKSVGGATVVLAIRGKDREAVESVDISYESIKADGEGKWSYALAPSSFDAINIGAWHQDCDITQGYFPMEDFQPISALRDGSAKLKLTRGQKVEGFVFSSDGKPVKADVGVGGDRVASNVVPPVKTDAAGHFSFGAKPGASVVITVKAPKHGPQLMEFVMGSEPKKLEFHLEPGKTLEGNVVDSDGKPLAGVYLYTDTWRGHRTIDYRMNTDKNGHFAWNGAPDDDVLMDIMKQGYAELRNHPMRPSTQPITITLSSPLHVSGEVVDADTGKPVESFRVIQGITFDGGKQISWQRDSSQTKARPGGKFDFNQGYPYPGYLVRIESDGYLPSDSRVYKTEEGKVELQFKLKKGEGITGVVMTPDGKPAADADVLLASKGSQVRVNNGQKDKYDRDSISAKTDAQGKFSLPPTIDAFTLVVLHDSGQANISSDQIAAAKNQVKLAAWAKVEGTVKIGSKPGAGEQVSMWGQDMMPSPDQPRVYRQYQTKTDAAGHFAFDRVFPGKFNASRQVQLGPQMTGGAQSRQVEAKAGETAKVDIGGTGRPVIGRLVPSADLPSDWITVQSQIMTKSELGKPPFPDNWAIMQPEDRKKWHETWRNSDEGKAYIAKSEAEAKKRRYYGFRVESDKTFRVEDVDAGKYTLTIIISKPDARRGWGQPIGTATADFEVAEMPGGRSDEPLDVGSIETKPIKGSISTTSTTTRAAN